METQHINESDWHIDGLVQEWRNSSALTMELCLSCTNPLICTSPINFYQLPWIFHAQMGGRDFLSHLPNQFIILLINLVEWFIVDIYGGMHVKYQSNHDPHNWYLRLQKMQSCSIMRYHISKLQFRIFLIDEILWNTNSIGKGLQLLNWIIGKGNLCLIFIIRFKKTICVLFHIYLIGL